tara:strand:+ start:1830 stop:2651 length:822 start_codon:yes stop_codon:yes gene_type:complete
MSIIRINKKESGYTLMSNIHLNDKKLSLKAKGLLSFMLTKPNNWDFSVMGLVSQVKESKTGVMSSMTELIDLKYVKRFQQKSVKGTFSSCDYDVYEKPYAQSPHTDNPTTENVTQVITDLSKELIKVTTDKEKKEDSIEVEFEEIITSNQLSIIDHIKEKEKSSAKKEVSVIEPKFNFRKEMIDYGFKEELVLDWLAVRKTKKATNTRTALKSFLKQVELSGDDVNKVLELCVERSWSGFKVKYLENVEGFSKFSTNGSETASQKLDKALGLD